MEVSENRNALGRKKQQRSFNFVFPQVVGVVFSLTCAELTAKNASLQVSGFIRDVKLSSGLPEDVSKVTFLHETGLIYCLCGFIERFWLLFSLGFFHVKPDGLSQDLFCGFDELKSPHPAAPNGAAL